MAAVALTLLGVVAWLVWLGQPAFPLDDAYIVQHSVQGLIAGAEERFVDSSPMMGATSPIHVLLILTASQIVPVDWAQAVLASMALLLFVLGVVAFCRREGLGSLESLLLCAVAVLSGMTLYQFLNGLETGLALAAVMWALVVFRDPIPARPWHNLLLGLLPFIRPELGALSVLLLGRELLALSRLRGLARPGLTAIAWTLAAAVPPVAFILWSGGSVIPNTLSAKAYFFAEGCIPILDKAQGLIRYMIPALASFGLLMFGFLWLVRSSLRWVTFGFAAMFLAAYLVQLPGAVTHNYFRYPTILVPFLVVGWVAALSTGLPARLRRANLVVLALSPAILLHTLPQTWTIYRNSIEHSRSELAGVASWVARNLPPTATVIVHDAGYISLEGQQSLVDLVGLKTSSSIPVNRATHWETCSRDPRAIVRIAEQTSADFIVVLELWDRIFRITDGLKDDGWTLERLDTERGDTSYRVYAIGRA